MRRNDVVVYNDDRAMMKMYGRVVRFIGKYHVEVVDCGRYRSLWPVQNVSVVDYKGTYHNDRFYHMPTLRKLKQMSRQYDKGVWKRNRPKKLEEESWPNGDSNSLDTAIPILILYGLD